MRLRKFWSPGWLLIILLGYLFSQPMPLLADVFRQDRLVVQEIHYDMPGAGEVFFVWGINGWATVPEASRPPGTVVKNKVMHTPMKIENDNFVVRIEIPINTTIDYGFLITKDHDGKNITAVWEANGSEDYHTTVIEDSITKIKSNIKLFQDQDQDQKTVNDALLVTQEIHYNNLKAGEVFLIWGINGWQTTPEASHPPGTIIKDKVMHTPMRSEANTFIIALQLPVNTTLDYGFLITKNKDGSEIEAIWEGDYQINVTGNVVEIQADLDVSRQIGANTRRGAGQRNEILLAIIVTIIIFSANFLAYFPYIRSSRFVQLHPALLPLGSILIVAVLLRLNHINQPFVDAFSWRQASTAMMADNFYRQSWNIFYPAVNWAGPEPSYQGREFQTVSYIAALLYTMLGQQDWIGRGLAILFGVWGIFALYQLVRRVWDEERALASAAIMAIMPGAILIERSFLPDPVMVALVVTSLWLLITYFQTNHLRYLILATLMGAWGLLTKLPGLIVGLPILYAMLSIFYHKKTLNLRKLITLSGVAILVLIPVVGYYLWVRHLSLVYPPYHFAGSGHWLWDQGLAEWLAQDYFLPRLFWNLDTWFWTKPIIILLCVGLLFLPFRGQSTQKRTPEENITDHSDKAPWFFHFWFLAGIFYYLIGARELVYNSWNFHIVSPAIAALAGNALVLISSFITKNIPWPNMRWLLAPMMTTLFLLLIVIAGQQGLRQMYYPQKPLDATESYKLGLALQKISVPGDLVVTIPNDIGQPVAIYYSQRRGWVFPPVSNDIDWSKLPPNSDQAIRSFEELRANGADWFGIVDAHRNEIWQKLPLFAEHIEQNCKIYSETSEYIIYRIQQPEEVAQPILSQD